MNRLSVLMVGQNFRVVGGSDKYMLLLTRLLGLYGHTVIPFAGHHARNLSTPWSRYFPKCANFDAPGLLDILRFIYSLPARRCISQLLLEHDVDIAHLHIYYGKLTSSILSPLCEAEIPIVQTLHEYKLVCPVYSLYSHGAICEYCNGKYFHRAFFRRCNRGSLVRSALSLLESYVSNLLGSVTKVDHFIAVSDFQRERLIKLGMPGEKISTVHNFIDVFQIRSSTIPGKYFLYFGRIERNKGIFTLLKAADLFRDLPLYIVGTGSVQDEARAFASNHGLDHVKFLGFQQGAELDRLIRNSICTIAPSEWYEPFGLTLIESFAHARPVIASRIGGMTEVVSDSVDGFLISPGNAEQLAERMAWMVANQSNAVEMGQTGRRKVEAQFSPQGHYEKLLAIYRKVIG